jgi:hypothetical protein
MSVFSQRVLLVLVAVGLSVPALPAAGCLNGVSLAPPRKKKPLLVALSADQQPIRHLVLAEEALRLEDLKRAAHELDAIRLAMQQASARVKSRFERVSALVSLRSRGEWPLWTVRAAGNNELEREEIMNDALAALRRRAAALPDDPTRSTDLGVALFAFPGHHGEARKLLEGLANRDLITAARGYYALSRLRAAAGNHEGASTALATCQKLDPEGKACGGKVPAKA